MEYWIIGVLEKRKSITPLLQYTKKTKNIEQGTSIKTNYEYRMPNQPTGRQVSNVDH